MLDFIRHEEFLIDTLNQLVQGIQCEFFFKDHVLFAMLLLCLGSAPCPREPSASDVPLSLREILELALIIGEF
jgi:hypothetical protein